jgi:hypothetical protein
MMTLGNEDILIGNLKWKPKLTLPTFKIPEPYRAWCHSCKQGFMNLDELTEHNRQWHRVNSPVKVKNAVP